jgi:hypothetical protein
MLIARLNTYSAQIEAMQKAVSETDAQLANQVTGPAAFTAQYDSAGSTALNLPANLVYKLQNQSGQITGGITWEYVVISGTVNGNAAGATEYAVATDNGTGTFVLNSMVGTTAKIELRAYIGTMKWTFQTTISKELAAPSGGGGGGGGGGGSALPQTGTISIAISGTSFQQVGSVTGTTGASQTSVTLGTSCDISCNSINKTDSATVEIKLMRAGVQKGSTGSGSCSITNYEPIDGHVGTSGTDTVSANTSYTWEAWARCTVSGKSAVLNGSISAT